MQADAEWGVSRETQAQFRDFAKELERWSKAINLVSDGSLQDIWKRHIRDSLQVAEAAPAGVRLWCDLGSGGGLPAIVVALVLKDRGEETEMVCIESDARKAAFLRLMIARFDLRATVIAKRIESTDPVGADLVTARALAPLDSLLGYVDRHLAQGGLAILPKGRTFEAELREAQRRWRFHLETRPSVVDPDSRLLLIRNLERVKGQP